MRRVDVVPHTHWDREWYAPYPTFRLRLVDLLDELLPRLENDPAFTHFQLDGQMAVVDDYLGLRPWEEQRIHALAAAGRLSMGPWYVLPDEFLVSGETHVRNLQRGLRRAEDFGAAMRIGYLPDMFGHVAQMPQILSQFGFTDAVVWRGVPSGVHSSAFLWEAPDGSRVRAEYLPAGYGNGSDLSADPARVRETVDTFRLLQGDLAGDPILLMAGMDHEVPPAHLPAVVAELNAAEAASGGDLTYALSICSLAEHLAAARANDGDLTVLRGEMRSGHRANVLMGVASNRVDVKQAAAIAERTLERTAEPLAALWLTDPAHDGDAARWTPVFDMAWLGVIRNAAHDSICACSHDEVVEAVLHRYAEATRLARGVADRAAAAAARRMGAIGATVLNPTPRTRSGLVGIDIPGPSPEDGSDEPALQVLSEVPLVEEIEGALGDAAPMRLAVAMLAEHPWTRSVRLGYDDGALVAHLLATAPDEDSTSPGDALASVGLRSIEDPSLVLRLVVHRADASRHVLALASEVPGYGWSRWAPVEPAAPVVAQGMRGLSNGLVDVDVDTDDGTFTIDGRPGFGHLVDDGDAGDTYNWCPPEVDRVIDAPRTVTVERLESGPLRGRIAITSTYLLPERCTIDGREAMTTGWSGGDAYRRTGGIPTVITTTVELRADDPVVRVTTSWEQRSRDHRLRVHLPLPERTDRSEAEDAFATATRPLWVEGGPNEWGVPTFPSRRFVRAGGLTVTHEGLCEYELVELRTPDGSLFGAVGDAAVYGVEPPAGTTAGVLALTLVRSTGWLSRGPMPSRPQPAGPFDRLDGAQTIKPLVARYAIQLDTTPGALDPHALADHVWNPLIPVVAPGGGDLGERGSLLALDGLDGSARAQAPIEVDSLHRDDRGRLTLRVHATGGQPARLAVRGRRGSLVDLAGEVVGDFDEATDIGAHRIATLVVEDTNG